MVGDSQPAYGGFCDLPAASLRQLTAAYGGYPETEFDIEKGASVYYCRKFLFADGPETAYPYDRVDERADGPCP